MSIFWGEGRFVRTGTGGGNTGCDDPRKAGEWGLLPTNLGEGGSFVLFKFAFAFKLLCKLLAVCKLVLFGWLRE